LKFGGGGELTFVSGPNRAQVSDCFNHRGLVPFFFSDDTTPRGGGGPGDPRAWVSGRVRWVLGAHQFPRGFCFFLIFKFLFDVGGLRGGGDFFPFLVVFLLFFFLFISHFSPGGNGKIGGKGGVLRPG